MKLYIAFLVLFTGSVIRTDAGERKVSLGLLEIFNHFLNVTDLVGGMHPVIKTLAEDIINDVRRLIPEVEIILDKYNITEPVLQEIGNSLNMTRLTHDLLPELEKVLHDENITQIIEEIVGYLDFNRLKYEYLPELDKVIDEYNISQILDEIKALLNVTVIANELLPEIERGLEHENISKIVEEVENVIDMMDIEGKLIPNLEKIFESHNVSQIVHAIDDLLNLTKIAREILPGLGQLFEDLKLNETLQEIKKFLDVTQIHGLLDELEDLIDEANITYHVPDLEPFINISIIRSKLDEVEKIIDYLDIHGIIAEIEKFLDVDHLISKVPEFDEFLEDLGLTKILQDINELIEMSFLSGPVSDIKEFILNANLTNKIHNLEKLLNVNYLREVIVPEIDRMVEESNIDGLYDEARQLVNTTFLLENVIPEIEKVWYNLGVDAQLDLLLSLTNMTFLREFMEEFDREWNITLKGEQIANGDLPGVINGVLDGLFATVKPIVVPTTSPTTPKDTATTEATTQATTETPTLPPVCDSDCAGEPCGDAFTNICDECVLGSTGKDVNYGMDCNNECGGPARNDSCGVCSIPNLNGRSPFADCNGDCFGTAAIDSCENCADGNTGKKADYAKDACGICGGDNSSCAGCDGIPNSGKVMDSCQVCGGDGSTCTTISIIRPSMLPTTSQSGRVVTVHGAGLNGEAIKCLLDGEESSGTVINTTHCQCTIPSGKTAGTKTFTIKVVKDTTDVNTADLSITLYDSSTTKLTSLTPSEVLTDETTTFAFSGNGLVDSSTAVCIVTHDREKSYLPARYQSESYTCTLPAYMKSQSITLALSLNGIHELASDVSLTRTVFATAPSVLGAKFAPTGALIHVAFNRPIAVSSLTTCAHIFSTGLALLGTSPSCTWSDSQHLVIAPSDDATIVPSDSLTFKANSVKRDEMFGKALSGSVTVSGPDHAVEPVPFIMGPTQISSCGHLTLDGSQSSGGGGRNLKYEWSLEGQVDTGITEVLNNAMNKSRVFINGSLMTSGSTYQFKLTVKNFMHSVGKSSTIQVTKARDPLPEVTVDGPLEGKVFGMKSFYITAKATAASCSSSTALTFAWSVRCTHGDSADAAKAWVEASAGFTQTSTKFALKIDSGTLLAGRTYEFTVVVALTADVSIKTTVKTSVVVEWSPLEPSIVGGDRTVGRDGGKLVLDAKSASRDPDQADGDLHCSWKCSDKSNDQPCYSFVSRQQKIDFPNHCVIEIDSSHFEAEKSYLITSQVSKGSRSGESRIVLSVVAGRPPVVTTLNPSLRVVRSQRVRLEATYESSIRPVKVQWICEQKDDYRYINLSDASNFASTFEEYKANGTSVSVKVLKPNILTPGSSYMFTLKIDDGSSVGSSSMIVSVRTGPTSGYFEVSRTTLKQLQDITLSAPRWVTDSDAYPIKYVFGYLNDKGVFQPWETQTNNEYTISVPPGYGPNNILTLRVQIKDSFGSMKHMDKNITVNKLTNIDEDKVQDLMKKGLKSIKDTGDFSKVLPKMKNILRTVKQYSKASNFLKKKIANSTMTSLLLAVKSTSLDTEKAKPILDTFLEVQPSYIEEPSDTLDSIDKVVKASAKSLDKESIKEVFEWVGGVSSIADHKNDPGVSKDIVNTYQSLADGLFNDVDIGQSAVISSPENPNVAIKVAHSLLEGVLSADDSSESTQVDFGSEMADMCGQRECSSGKMCLGCQVKIITFKEDYFNDDSPNKPDVLSDKIMSLAINNPETGEQHEVQGLSQPLKIKFKTGSPEDGKKFECFYYKEESESWQSDGLTSVMNEGELECHSTHLTSFSPANAVDNTTQTDSSTTYEVSFILSNTTWNEMYSDSSDAATVALRDDILAAITEVYKNDSTMKNVQVESFQDANGKVKVQLKMIFTGSNNDPSAALKSSMADGKLGQIAVDPSSLTFVEKKVHEDKDEDDIALIIGIVVGVAFVVVLIALLMAYLVYRSKQGTKVESLRPTSPPYQSYENKGSTMDEHEMTPV